ncbi:cytochrome P450 [Kitasatospora purpeofusca]|uniref:cytochrome P450 n=1 Tax=Kitasatospora purpeofusca TaxID=67352 RepID=UPI0037F5A67B
MPIDRTLVTDPYPALARLRTHAPVHRLRTADGASWMLTRDADVRRASTDPRLTVERPATHAGNGGFMLPSPLADNLLSRDGAEHTRLRRITAPAFSARHSETLRPRVEAVTQRLLAGLTRRTHFDLITDFAIPLPTTIVADLLGLPARQRPELAHWTTAMVTHTRHDQLDQAVTGVHQLLTRHHHPADGGILASWARTHHHITPDELLSLAFQLWWAGIENITHAIAHHAHLLLTHPHHAHTLRTHPHTLPTAVEELLRHSAPTALAAPRYARQDLTIAGTPIRAGETVLLSLASANRDPARHTDPDRFDPTRTRTPHLAFGRGPHHCPGAALARIQLQTALTHLLHLPGLSVADPTAPVRRRTSLRLHGITELPLTHTPAHAGTLPRPCPADRRAEPTVPARP